MVVPTRFSAENADCFGGWDGSDTAGSQGVSGFHG